MSSLESSGNNQLPPPSSPSQTAIGREHRRDSSFYYEDGNVVFLADDVLFKVYKLLLESDPDVESFEFQPLMEDMIDHSIDKHPITLPMDIEASQFRDFLLAVFGRIGDNDYMQLLAAAQNYLCYGPRFIGRFTNIGSIAVRFGMSNLDRWAETQIYSIVQSWERGNIKMDWDAKLLMQVVAYMQATRTTTHQHDFWTTLRRILCVSALGIITSNGQAPVKLDAFVSLYKDRSLRANKPGIFGFIFATILAFGHRSPAWNDYLNRDDRRILYAANTLLTCLCNHDDLEVRWLFRPATVKDVCSQPSCSQKFESHWNNSFVACKIDSPIPSEDIRHVVRVPLYRKAFEDQRPVWSCASRCLERTLAKIDASIERLFCGLAEKHSYWASTV